MKIIYLILFIYSLTSFSQNKKEYILDENNQNITNTIFLKQLKEREGKCPIYFSTFFENDTAKIGKLLLRKELGKFTEDKLAAVRQELSILTGKISDDKNTIIINYFYDNEDKVEMDRIIKLHYNNKKYKKFVTRNSDVVDYFIYGRGLMNSDENIYEDKKNIIRDLLFEYKFESNYIIIKPNGNYYRQVSEYRQDEIPDIIKADW